jgi:hypothetical protein
MEGRGASHARRATPSLILAPALIHACGGDTIDGTHGVLSRWSMRRGVSPWCAWSRARAAPPPLECFAPFARRTRGVHHQNQTLPCQRATKSCLAFHRVDEGFRARSLSDPSFSNRVAASSQMQRLIMKVSWSSYKFRQPRFFPKMFF